MPNVAVLVAEGRAAMVLAASLAAPPIAAAAVACVALALFGARLRAHEGPPAHLARLLAVGAVLALSGTALGGALFAFARRIVELAAR